MKMGPAFISSEGILQSLAILMRHNVCGLWIFEDQEQEESKPCGSCRLKSATDHQNVKLSIKLFVFQLVFRFVVYRSGTLPAEAASWQFCQWPLRPNPQWKMEGNSGTATSEQVVRWGTGRNPPEPTHTLSILIKVLDLPSITKHSFSSWKSNLAWPAIQVIISYRDSSTPISADRSQTYQDPAWRDIKYAMEQQINRPAMNAAHLPCAIHLTVAFLQGGTCCAWCFAEPLECGQDEETCKQSQRY